MQNRVIILQDGKRVVLANGLLFQEHQNPVVKEYDLTQATPVEIESLKQNPNNDQLLTSIQMRKK